MTFPNHMALLKVSHCRSRKISRSSDYNIFGAFEIINVAIRPHIAGWTDYRLKLDLFILLATIVTVPFGHLQDRVSQSDEVNFLYSMISAAFRRFEKNMRFQP